jgi:arylsulfatase A-like enzyme
MFTDQQRFDALGCSGNTEILTPNMDALASSGARFTQTFTSTPVFVAARMSMLTGRRVSRHSHQQQAAGPDSGSAYADDMPL